MAEEWLGVLDGEAPSEGSERPGAQGAEALAMARAPDSAEARSFFDASRRLAERQLAVFDHEFRLRHFGQAIRVGLQLFVALVATVAGLMAAAMVASALTSHSVVVDSFDVPPSLAGQGLTGKVVATGVLDALQRLQAATRDTTRGLPTQGAWTSDIKVDVPDTGVSLGEIDRALHQRFGHDIHIDGEVVASAPGRLTLTVRGESVPAASFEGASGELSQLTTKAAEYVYGRSQPHRYALYLEDQNRNAEALAFIPGAYARATTDQDRADLAVDWGAAYSGLFQVPQAVAKDRLALSLEPDDWRAWGDLIGSLSILDEEDAWREAKAMERLARRSASKLEPRDWANSALVEQDWPQEAASLAADVKANGGGGATTVIDGPGIADAYARMHDWTSASKWLAASDPADPATREEAMLVAAYAMLESGQAARAAAELAPFWKAWLADPSAQFTFNDAPCFVGLAFGLSGRTAEAQAAFARGARQALCFAMQGDVLEHAGDLAGAERAWAAGLAIGPDLAPVRLHRGISEARRGDDKDALIDLSLAHAKAPHWADPLKAWGDALAAQGRWREAVAEYDAAQTYAPAWVELRRARRVAQAHLG